MNIGHSSSILLFLLLHNVSLTLHSVWKQKWDMINSIMQLVMNIINCTYKCHVNKPAALPMFEINCFPLVDYIVTNPPPSTVQSLQWLTSTKSPWIEEFYNIVLTVELNSIIWIYNSHNIQKLGRCMSTQWITSR